MRGPARFRAQNSGLCCLYPPCHLLDSTMSLFLGNKQPDRQESLAFQPVALRLMKDDSEITVRRWRGEFSYVAKKQRVSPDDVEKLIRGKASVSRAGSRNIRHRLRQDEVRRLAVARARGFLLLTNSTRAALRNSWYLECQARGRPCIYAARSEAGFLVSGAGEQESLRRTFSTLDEVVAFSELYRSHGE